ncbi:hypothetical protein ACUVI8_08485 (plasmid) [Campylobacter jejuni]
MLAQKKNSKKKIPKKKATNKHNLMATLFKLIAFKDEKTQKLAKEKLLNAYIELFDKLNELKVTWLELDEPYLVYDLSKEDIALFEEFYQELKSQKRS